MTGVSAEDFVARASQHDIGGETVARNSAYPWDDETATAEPQAESRARDKGEEEDELNAS